MEFEFFSEHQIEDSSESIPTLIHCDQIVFSNEICFNVIVFCSSADVPANPPLPGLHLSLEYSGIGAHLFSTSICLCHRDSKL